MGNAAAVFAAQEPNFEALSVMITKYEQLKKSGNEICLEDLYHELEKELAVLARQNGTDSQRFKEAATRLKELEDTLGANSSLTGSKRLFQMRNEMNDKDPKRDNPKVAPEVGSKSSSVRRSQTDAEAGGSSRKKSMDSNKSAPNQSGTAPSTARGRSSSVIGASNEQMNILVVDDSHISCKLAVRQLGKLNFKVETAFSGESALQKVTSSPNKYDLVLLDIVMPGIDGIEVLSKMKSSPDLNHIPVAMLSGLEDQTLAEVCLQQGATEVLLKPLKVEAVQRVASMHCTKKLTSKADKNQTLELGDEAPDFSLPDSNFTHQALASKLIDKRKVMLVFFPVAFASTSVYGSSLLAEINKKYFAIKSTNTLVYAIGKELPFTMAALCQALDLKFPVLSDPSLKVCEKYVGSFEFGDYYMRVTGVHTAGLMNYRSANLGVVVVDSHQKVAYKWVAAEENGDANPSLPFDMPKILEFLDSDTRNSPKLDDASDGATIRTASKQSILIVDDSNISSKLALRKLVSLGYDTMHAENGKVALELLRRFPKDFDLVLLDIVMPIMDGVELLTTIQDDNDLKKIPVCMLSGLEDETLANVCLESGAVAVLRKPINTDQVQEIMDGLKNKGT
mmetsp:Transcript_3413/g.4799  ORF Transcript_3413/g.4799 Transcript_3413/m.4799 type:complete len:622 (-) Transcript_3413:198-2063(-)